MEKLAKMPNSRRFVIAEIDKIDLQALFFRILKIPMVKIQIFG